MAIDDPKSPDCKVCSLHGGVMLKLKILTWLAVIILGAVGIKTGAEVISIRRSSQVRHDFDVHVASQGQRMKHIEKTLDRIEDLLRRDHPSP